MEKLARITFIALNGDPPTELALDAIPAAEDVASIIKEAFGPFLSESGDVVFVERVATATAPASGLHLVYVYGHVWTDESGPHAATRTDGASLIEDSGDLLRRLLQPAVAERTILILDCCHAAAFDPYIVSFCTPRLVVFGSAANEQAIALPNENASRLSLAIAKCLSGHPDSIDLTRVISEVVDRLEKDSVLRGQSVRYRSQGLGVRLARGAMAPQKLRERTVTIVRNILVATGAIVAVVLGLLGWFYWSHTLVEVDLTGLHAITNEVRLTASEETPSQNLSRVFKRKTVNSNRIRFWSPASNVIVRLDADYNDGAERALAFHVNLVPGFRPASKSLAFALPVASHVAAHPNMAYVPVTNWIHGSDNAPRTNSRPFWIDIRPPTVLEYEPVAETLLNSGELDRENSFLLSWRQRSNAVDALGSTRLRQLNEDLGAVFGIIEAGTSSRVAAPGDIVVGLGELPCDSCPAIMTRFEAGQYCLKRGMRLPTDLEWELAVRGVDGRIYPWGNQFDPTRANVPGLPQQGDPPAQLKPVASYRHERSPFGLIDAVGNAGDWVINESGSFERVYMGATYRYNPEDATTFRLLPVTDADYLVREITARCVADVRVPIAPSPR